MASSIERQARCARTKIPHGIATAVATAIATALACTHSPPSAAQTAVAPPVTKLDDLVVIGNSLDARDVVAPVSTLQGTNLLIKRGSTLGETLDTLPGVSQTWFGPNASRPVIRGLDGDRVRVLNNLGASFDAASVSVDHNPAIDPLVIERIEVLRGPAALLYGGTAIGGVVNIVDNRIPHTITAGVSGAVETRFGGAARETGNAAVLELGLDKFAAHADAFSRDTDDYRVPRSTGLSVGNGNRVVNSASQSKGGAIGASYQFAKGHVGASYVDYRTNYGTVAEENVRIDLKQISTAVEANFHDLGGAIDGVFARFGHTDYQHTELNDNLPATRFNNNGDEFRLEAKLAKLGGLKGVVGMQVGRFAFSALGEEAFVPRTRTNNDAGFIFEEWIGGRLKFSAGGRAERSSVRSNGAEVDTNVRFGAARTRTFTLASASVGASVQLTKTLTLGSNYANASRAPSFYELFANGPHVATGAYEIGDSTFGRERSNAVDLGLRWKDGDSSARVGVFAQQFRNYIASKRSGINRDVAGNGAGTGVRDCGNGTSAESGCTAALLPEFRYQQIDARLGGFEAEGMWRIVSQPYTLDLEAKTDYVRTQDLTNGEPLPRVTPFRVSGGVIWAMDAIGARIEVQNSATQNRFSRDDAIGATAGYMFINAAATYAFEIANMRGMVFLRGTNLADRKAFNAASFDTIRALAPLPGRSLKTGVQVNF